MSNTTDYAITVKCIKAGYFATCLELECEMAIIVGKHKGDIINYFFEQDSLQRWHLHGTFRARKNLRFSLFKRPYMHIHIDHLPTYADYLNWQKYIQKDQTTSDKEPYLINHELNNQLLNEYCFVNRASS